MGQTTKASDIYSSLDPVQKQVRVLNIEESPDMKGRVVSQLEILSLSHDQQPLYEAVSWCWSDVTITRDILLNGQLWSVPTNAVDFLEVARSTGRHSRVWLDAVCINQADLDERANQVSLMHEVYSLASRVLIWSGQETSSLTNQAFASLEMLRTHFMASTEQYAPHRYAVFRKGGNRPEPSYSARPLPECDWRALEHFFSTPWFSRLWVCQEVMLNKNALYMCGIHRLSWEVLGLAACWLRHCKYERPEYMGKVLTSLWNAAQLWEYSFAIAPDWANLLALCNTRRATNPVDHVYSLLGIAKKTSASSAITAEVHLKPDYSKDLRLVFAAATRLAIQARHTVTNALNTLWLARIKASPDASSKVTLEPDDDDWPSWVPRYHWIIDTSRGSPRGMTDWHGDNAAGTYRILQMGEYSKSPLVLNIKGLIIATVLTTHFILDQDFVMQNDDHLSQQILSARRFCLLNGKSELDLAMTLTSRKTNFDLDASTDETFYDNYKAFISECRPRFVSQRWSPQAKAYKAAMLRGSINRRFFLTKAGRFGVGHPKMRPGDHVCLLFAGISPFILRHEKGHWRLIGFAYIPNLMHGEYIEQWQKRPGHDSDIVTFDIH